MDVVRYAEAEQYEPDEEWERRSLAGSDRFTFEWFTKPPGHSSPMYDHENEQVCVVLKGELTLHSEDGSPVVLEKYDSAWLEPWESHSVENTGDETAIGLDVFAPGRGFDYWLDKDD